MKGSLKGVCIALIISVVGFGMALTVMIHPFLPIIICSSLTVIIFAYLFYDGD